MKTREFGYELSGMEYKLVFDSDDIGFVRFDGRSKRIFNLDPSPYLRTPKRELYIIEDDSVPLPNENEFIKVTSLESEKSVRGALGYLANFKINYVRSWEKVDPNTVMHRKVMDLEEYVNFFKHPFYNTDKDADGISQCLAMCSVSSNAIGVNDKGGIDSGIIANKMGWDSFTSLQRLIPNEFKSTKSPYFYDSFDVDKTVNPVASTEVNLSILMPKKSFVHVPVAFDADLRPKSSYLGDISFEIPFVRAHLLDSLLFQPEVTKKAEKCLTEHVYEMSETFTKSSNLVYKQDLGDAAPKLGSSIARMNFRNELSVDDIREGFNVWIDMFEHSCKFQKSSLSLDEIFRLPAEAARLYLELEDQFGIDKLISLDNVEKILDLTPFELSNALTSLKKAGAVYSPRINFINPTLTVKINKSVLSFVVFG
ncbi:hypothetical protein [uncultured Methanolobus sp.]|uniref:hypothetical protein n=1 Tax=uncultured Methanolobus sp. TaxID=218300 RepID=UPI002AAB9AC7|nr:hypothetical protein [uncultured Methanolobus sp.]